MTSPVNLPNQALLQGMQLLHAGQLAEAEQVFLNILASDQENSHARFALGITCYQLGRLDDAERYLSETITRRPDFLPAYNNLGLVYKALGQSERGMATLRRVLEIQPDYVDAIYNFALMQEEAGDSTNAIESYRRAIRLKADFLRAHTNLGLLLRNAGDVTGGHGHLAFVAASQPLDAAALVNLLLVLTDLGRYAEAIDVGRRVAQLAPDLVSAWEALGNAQRLAGDASNAVISLQRALTMRPESVELQYELGLAQNAAGDIDAARKSLNAVARSRPDWLKALFARDLALPLLYLNDQHIADCNAGFTAGLENIEARLLGDGGWSVQGALDAISGYAPFYLHYQGLDNTKLQRRFGRIVETVSKRAWPKFAEPVAWKPLSHGSRVRVGFVSAYLRRHSVGLFFADWICELDKAKFESSVWFTGESGDAITERISAHATHYCHLVSDIDALAQAIHASQLDILIYLDVGMHPHAQVLAALRLAPVQCATFGHPVTTGIESIRYFLSAEAAEPDNAEQHYSEQLIRLPGFGICYHQPDASRQRKPAHFATPHRPFVLCTQPLFKILPQFDHVVARIAHALPGCRLAFFESLWPRVNQAFVSRMGNVLRKVGMDPLKTLQMLPIMPYEEYLGTLAAADVVLDTPGFSGGNSSFDAIAVGAPIITWGGQMLRARQTRAMLEIVGLPEFASQTADDYVQKAIAMASSPPLRREVRERMNAGRSALFNDVSTVRALESALLALVS